MSASTTKTVYLRRMDSSLVEGYVSPQTYLRPEGVEVLKRTAEAVVVPYEQIRAVYFVRDFDQPPDGEDQKRAEYDAAMKQGNAGGSGSWLHFVS